MSSERTASEFYGRDFPAGAVVLEEGDPRARHDALAAGELAEALDVAIEEPDGVAARLLRARAGPEAGAGDRGWSELEEYLSLRGRCEPDEGGRNAP